MRKKLLFGVLTLLLMAAVVEVAVRLLTPMFWAEYTVGAIRDGMGALGEAAAEDDPEGASSRARESIHPYLGYVATPGTGMAEKSYPVTPQRLKHQFGSGEPWWLSLEANNWGFWSPHTMPYERGPDDFVVVVLGGSVGQWLALQGRDVLVEELGLRLDGKNVVLLSFAMSGFKQPQQAQLLTYLLAHGMRFDAVVNLDGFNDAGIAYHNVESGLSPDYPRADLWPFLLSGLGYSGRALDLLGEQFREKRRTARLAARAEKWVGISNVLGIALAQAARRSETREQILYAQFQSVIAEDVPTFRRFAVRGAAADLPADRRIEEIVRIWADGSRVLASICAANGIAYLHVLQPVLHDTSARPAKPLSAAEQAIAANREGNWGVWADGVERIYPLFREEGRALREAGVAFEDLTSLFGETTETIYYDICHYNQQGNEMLARAIAARLGTQLPGALVHEQVQ